MAEELKGLIEKIQEEGVKAAEDKARSIQNNAKEKAKDIIESAKKQAENLISEAKARISKMESGGRDSLKQAGRDLILTLHKEINATLDRIIVSQIRQALSPGELAKIITTAVKESGGKEKRDITISLKSDDLEKIEKSLLSQLTAEAKNGITLKASGDIRGGFIISYDKGKSYYDFTDQALAEYISGYLKPKLAEMLKEESPAGKKTKKSG